MNKCVADIYTIFNYLEKRNVYLYDNDLSKKILTCLFPILPSLSTKLYSDLFKTSIFNFWPKIQKKLLIENKINLKIQIKCKLITTIETNKGYVEKEILKTIYQLDKIRNKIENKKIIKVINVQDKIINIIVG